MGYEPSEGMLSTLSMNIATALTIIGMVGIVIIVMLLFFFPYNNKIKQYFILLYSMSIIGMIFTELQQTFISDDLVNTMQLSRGVVVVTISLFIWMLIILGIFLWIYSGEKLSINGHWLFQILVYVISIIILTVIIYALICLISGQSVKHLIDLTSFDSFSIDGLWDPSYSAVINIITLFFYAPVVF